MLVPSRVVCVCARAAALDDYYLVCSPLFLPHEDLRARRVQRMYLYILISLIYFLRYLHYLPLKTIVKITREEMPYTYALNYYKYNANKIIKEKHPLVLFIKRVFFFQ